MFGNHLRRKASFALVLGLSLLSGAGRAQTPSTYSFTFSSPNSPTTIYEFDGDTSPTGGDPTFLRPQENYSYLLPPGFFNVAGQNNVPYKYMNFTLTANPLQANPNNYNLYCLGANANYLCAADIYPGTYTPGQPNPGGFDPMNTLSNIVGAYPNNTSAANRFPVVLPPGNYTLVVHGDSNGVTEGFTSSLTQAVIFDTPVLSVAGSTAGPGASPLWNRPNTPTGGGPIVSVSTGNDYSYNVQSFTVPADGTYQLLSTPQGSLNSDIFLYQNSFDPTRPLTNVVAGAGSATQGSGNLVASLTAGTTYYFVTSTNSPGIQSSTSGNFTDTVSPATVTNPAGWTGTITTSSPTFKKPNTATPPTAGTVTTYYDAHTYAATATGTLKITVAGSGSPALAGSFFVYNGAFNPASPTTNAVTAATIASTSSLAVNVTAGITYTIVTAGAAATTVGSYTGSLTLITTTAPTTTFTGTLTPGAVTTANRPNAGTPPAAVSTGAYAYSAQSFTVTTEGDYNITPAVPIVYTNAAGTTTANTWTPYVTLYNGPFTASAPLVNAVTTATGSIASTHLTPGNYTAVISGSATSTIGDYTLLAQKILDSGQRVTFNGTVNGGTGAGFNPPAVNGSSAPAALSGYDATSQGGNLDFYDVHSFTVPTTGPYSFDAISALKPFWDDYVVLYHDSFNPASPLTNAVIANDTINITGTDAGFRGVTLTAGVTYYVVVTGGGTVAPQQFGKYHGRLYTGTGTQYPPIIPDKSNNGVFDATLANGLSAAITVPDAFTVGTLNNVTINYLYHPHVGDLVATLTHAGTTIELFDRLGRTSATGSGKSTLLYGDYTFAPTGSDMLTNANNAGTGAIDSNLPYSQSLNGTAGQSATYTGDFTAFTGLPATGDWTLNIQDLVSGSVGFYEGFSFSVTPALAGNIALEGVTDLSSVSAAAPLGVFDIQFRAPGTLAPLYEYNSVTLTTKPGKASGSYTLTPIANGTYDVWIKGSKNLAVLIPNVVISSTNGTIPDVLLNGGDVDNDNAVGPTDFGIFVTVYNTDSSVIGGGYDPTADFNFDGKVDPTDFGIFVGDYNTAGAI